jgi:hypothetical protein
LNHQGPDCNNLRSRWRETAFALRQLGRAICPDLSLGKTIREWGAISAALSESPRSRTRQIARIRKILARN